MSGATGAAAAAAAHPRMIQEEEEHMTSYSSEDLKQWEFKIVRSTFNAFGNQQTLQKVLQEEAEAGWELVEKFDNARIRLRRRKEERERDGHRTIDPYRSMYGAGEWSAVVIIFSVLIFIVIIAGLIAEIVTM